MQGYASFFLILTLVRRSVFAQDPAGVLYPQESETREVKSLSGIWHFRADFEGEAGFQREWFTTPLHKTGPVELMPVPSSYNDITQSKKIRDHIGWVWYSTEFFVPASWKEQRVFVRFGSANRFACLWVNGHHATNHSGGYLPFGAEIGSRLNFGKSNYLVLALNNSLTQSTIPQGTLHYPNDTSRYPEGFVSQTYNFDYFNFAGIHRPVFLYTTPKVFINDITVVTDYDESSGFGEIFYQVDYSVPKEMENSVDFDKTEVMCLVTIEEQDGPQVLSSAPTPNEEGQCSSIFRLPEVKLWWPYLSNPAGEKPGYLYTLVVRVKTKAEEDVYRLKFGVRTVRVNNHGFFINGKPFYFQGFGRHEDYSIRGRGVDPVMLVKDHNLIQWIGANSYRTSHYPYAEEILDLTDQLGIVVIDESPAIGLTGYWKFLEKEHIHTMKELVQRDKNRPSVVMWSIGNEPKSMEKPAPAYFDRVITATRKFDPSKRPITIVLSQNFSEGICPDLDVISINRYYGWYGDTGRTEVIPLQIPTEVHLWHKSYRKPVLITEYGAGTVAGFHQGPSFVWTEDFQVDYLLQHFKAFDHLRQTAPYFLGEMIWNFADFATPEETFRPWGCMKGVFTRERQPKAAAHLLRWRYWTLASNQSNSTSATTPPDLLLQAPFLP